MNARRATGARRRIITDRELAHARQMRRDGATQTRIARELGVSQPTVARLMAADGMAGTRRAATEYKGRHPNTPEGARRTPMGDRASELYSRRTGPQDVMAACSGCTPVDLDRSPCPGHAAGYSVGPRESWSGLLDRLFDRRRRAGGEEPYRRALRDFAAAFADLAAPALPTLTAQ